MPVSDYENIIQAAAHEWNVDPILIKAVMHQESGGNPHDKRGMPLVGTSGEKGLMQIMPATAKELGVTDAHDPVQAIFGGAKYLSKQLDRFPDNPAMAVAAYNANADRVARGDLPASTRNIYLPGVASAYQMFSKSGGVAARTGGTDTAGPGATSISTKPSANFKFPPEWTPEQRAAATETMDAAPYYQQPKTTAVVSSAPPVNTLLSDDDFLKQTGAGKQAETSLQADDEFLKATGAKVSGSAPITQVTPPTPNDISGEGRDEYGQPLGPLAVTPRETLPDAGAAGRATRGVIGNALSSVGRETRNILSETGTDASTLGRDIARGAAEGFGSGPLGLSDHSVNALRSMGPFPDLAEAGARPISAAAQLFLRGASGALRGAQEGVISLGKLADISIPYIGSSQQAARDLAAMPEAFAGIVSGGGARGNPLRGEPIAITENPLTRRTVGGPNLNAASQAALTEDIMNPPHSSPGTRNLMPKRITTAQVQARDGVGAIEAQRRAEAENFAAEAGIPGSVGAAASREGTPPAAMVETPAQKATALQKMVNQSAEDRLTPQGRDDATYFPRVVRPEAMRDFTPAAEGKMASAMEHKTLYNTDTHYHDQFDALVKKNNDVMVDTLHDMFGDANARDAAMNEAKELMPGSIDLFAGEKAVNAQPIEARIQAILTSPAGKRGSVRSVLNGILANLKDADGNLENLPSMLKGIRDDITDKLYDKSPTVEGNAARTARNQLQDVLSVVDDTIGKGLPGTKYQDYLANLSAALGKVSKLDYMQQFLTGSRKLTNQAGDLQLSKVNRMLDDIQKRHADKTGGAKEMTMDEINLIEAARNELAAKDLLDRRAAVRGSPTVQLGNASGILGSGPLGAGVRGAAEAATHAGLMATTWGVGNALLGGYKYVIKPAVQAARDRAAANALAATKNRLLSTDQPFNPLRSPE